VSAVLEITDMSITYGALRALDAVNLSVARGEIVGLIGPNGAGKTSLLDAVTGFARASGQVRLDGRDITALPPHRRARLGLARTWQAGDLFEDLTVEENVLAGAVHPSIRATLVEIIRGRPIVTSAATETLELFGLAHVAASMPSELTTGQRRLVGVARAVVVRPQILLLDEPAAGLDTSETTDLGQRLRGVLSEDTSIILIDHDMGLVLRVCDRIYVLDFGRVIAQGTPQEIRENPAVVAAYLGAAGAKEVAHLS
jgi:branched-chain amino acid transport system ATP-binding protein